MSAELGQRPTDAVALGEKRCWDRPTVITICWANVIQQSEEWIEIMVAPVAKNGLRQPRRGAVVGIIGVYVPVRVVPGESSVAQMIDTGAVLRE